MYKAQLPNENIGQKAAPGQVITDGKTYLAFGTADAALKLEEVQMEGKKRMGVEEFLRGVKIA